MFTPTSEDDEEEEDDDKMKDVVPPATVAGGACPDDYDKDSRNRAIHGRQGQVVLARSGRGHPAHGDGGGPCHVPPTTTTAAAARASPGRVGGPNGTAVSGVHASVLSAAVRVAAAAVHAAGRPCLGAAGAVGASAVRRPCLC
jgi:hypothetical protein